MSMFIFEASYLVSQTGGSTGPGGLMLMTRKRGKTFSGFLDSFGNATLNTFWISRWWLVTFPFGEPSTAKPIHTSVRGIHPYKNAKYPENLKEESWRWRSSLTIPSLIIREQKTSGEEHSDISNRTAASVSKESGWLVGSKCPLKYFGIGDWLFLLYVPCFFVAKHVLKLRLIWFTVICFWSICVTRNRWRHTQTIVAGSCILYIIYDISTHASFESFFSSIAFWICELFSLTHSCALPSQEKPLFLNHVTVRIDLETRGSWCSHGWSCRDWVSERPVSSPCALNRVRC